MTDKAKAPVETTREADIDPAGNTDFMAQMLGGHEDLSYDDAVNKITNSKGLLDEFVRGDADNQSEDGEDDRAVRSDETGQDDESPEDDDDHEEDADDEGQDDESPEEKSEDDDGFELLTRDENGKLQKLGLDDVEVPIELDGEQQFMTFSEIQKELKDNRLRRDDYTRKMQDIGNRVSQEVRKQTSERQAQLDQGHDNLKVILSAFGSQLDQDVSFEDLKKQYGGDAEKAGNALAQMQAFKQKLKSASNDMHQRQDQITSENIDATLASVQDSTPEYRDPRVFKKALGDMREFFVSEGLDDNDIVAILQKPAYFALAKKAFEGDKLVKRTKPTARTKKVRRLGKGTAKTVQKTPSARRARKSTRPTNDIFQGLNGGSVGMSESDAASAIERVLG